MVLANEDRIKTIQEKHSAATPKKNSDLRDIVSARHYDKKVSNLVSKFYVIDPSLTRTNFSTSDLLFILLSVIYKVINQLYDERKLLHTSTNQKVEEAQMMATTAQLDAVTTVLSERAASVHNINAITANHKLPMKEYHAMRDKQMNQLVSVK